ncbi:GNAT family N-acetyltransferase [Acidihalobacter ferrooxydans]
MKARLSAVSPSADHVIYVYCDDRTAPSAWLHVMRTFHLESGFAAEIAGLVVNESQRGRGIGAALVAEAIG